MLLLAGQQNCEGEALFPIDEMYVHRRNAGDLSNLLPFACLRHCNVYMANTKVYKTSAGPPSPPSSSIACLVLLLLMMMLIVGRSVGRMRTSYSPLASSPLLHKYMLHFVTNRILFLSPSCHVRVPYFYIFFN